MVKVFFPLLQFGIAIFRLRLYKQMYATFSIYSIPHRYINQPNNIERLPGDSTK